MTTYEETIKIIDEIKEYLQDLKERKARAPAAWNKFVEESEIKK